MRDRRLGRFDIASELIDSDPRAVQALMGHCIIVRAEYLFAENTIHYVAISSDFEDCPVGQVLPIYTPQFRKENDKAVFVGWKKSV